VEIRNVNCRVLEFMRKLLYWYSLYRGADRSSVRPGRNRARKHVRDKCNFNNIETRVVINFFFLQGKAPKEIHAILTETLACFLPGRAKDLSARLYKPPSAHNEIQLKNILYNSHDIKPVDAHHELLYIMICTYLIISTVFYFVDLIVGILKRRKGTVWATQECIFIFNVVTSILKMEAEFCSETLSRVRFRRPWDDSLLLV